MKRLHYQIPMPDNSVNVIIAIKDDQVRNKPVSIYKFGVRATFFLVDAHISESRKIESEISVIASRTTLYFVSCL